MPSSDEAGKDSSSSRSIEEIDEEIQQLEKQVEDGTMTPREAKNVSRRISRLQKQRERRATAERSDTGPFPLALTPRQAAILSDPAYAGLSSQLLASTSPSALTAHVLRTLSQLPVRFRAFARTLKEHALAYPYQTAWILTCLITIPFGGPLGVLLRGVGFASGGVVGGSLAAAWHSAIGNVAAGSLFAGLQATGATIAGSVLAGVLPMVAGVAVSLVVKKVRGLWRRGDSG